MLVSARNPPENAPAQAEAFTEYSHEPEIPAEGKAELVEAADGPQPEVKLVQSDDSPLAPASFGGVEPQATTEIIENRRVDSFLIPRGIPPPYVGMASRAGPGDQYRCQLLRRQ